MSTPCPAAHAGIPHNPEGHVWFDGNHTRTEYRCPGVLMHRAAQRDRERAAFLDQVLADVEATSLMSRYDDGDLMDAEGWPPSTARSLRQRAEERLRQARDEARLRPPDTSWLETEPISDWLILQDWLKVAAWPGTFLIYALFDYLRVLRTEWIAVVRDAVKR